MLGLIRATMLVTVGALGLAGCSSLPLGDGITDLTLNVRVTSDANPDDTGRGSPVYLSLFELRDTGSFERADYLALYSDARAALGGALVDVTEIGPLFPDSAETRELRLNTATTAVGIMGGFNRYSEMQTGITVTPEPGEDMEIDIVIDGRGLHLE